VHGRTVTRLVSLGMIALVMTALLGGSFAPGAEAGLTTDLAAARTPKPHKTPAPTATATSTTVNETSTTTTDTSTTTTDTSTTTTDTSTTSQTSTTSETSTSTSTTTETSTATTTTTTSTTTTPTPSPSPTPQPCVPSGSNPVVAENTCAGSAAWKIPTTGNQVADDANGQIKGYASATSVNKGGSIAFKVSVNPAQSYSIDVYRMGWYGGAGGRWMLNVPDLAGTKQATCPIDGNGTIQCAWATAYTLNVPTSWTSGIYLAVLTNANHFQNYIDFVVRDDSRNAQVLYQQPVTTYEAYNNYPNDGVTGKSLYTSSSFGPITTSGTVAASKVSFDRPYTGNGSAGSGGFLAWEADAVHWLERSGYDIAYSTDVDTHENGSRLLNYEAVLTVGHDEYWSKQMFDAFQNARDGGTSLGFIGGNDVYWQIRFESSGTGVPDRIITCYKNASKDPNSTASLKTIQWRAVGRPEQTLIGIQYASDIGGDNDYVVTNASHWIFRGTNFVNGTHVHGIVGGEGDRYQSSYPLPAYRYWDLLSNSPFPIRDVSPTQMDYANSSMYQAPSRAWVFAVGTFQWGWGLDKSGYVDSRIQKTTANALAAMLDHTNPVVTAPRIRLNASGTAGTSSMGAIVEWTGTDNATFVERYVLQQSTDGGSFVTVQDGAAASMSVTLSYGHKYQFRVTGADTANLWSGWSTAPVLTPTLYQESSASITYGGSWGTVSSANDLGGAHKYSTSSGASAQITFTGESIAIVGIRTSSGSNVSVFVDGSSYPTLTFQAGSTTYRQLIASYTWSSVGTHTVKIVNQATSGRPYVYLDAFVIAK
jgi:hypothetical protein